MKYVVTNEQMAAAEKNAAAKGTPFIQLMRNAGVACFEKINELLGSVSGKNFVVLCGKGNNGGDGFIISKRICESGGTAVTVFVGELPKSETAKECLDFCESSIETAYYVHNEAEVKSKLTSADVIIDCVFGIGFSGALDDSLSGLFSFINESCTCTKFSIDVPSGVNSDTGEVAKNAFQPDITLTLSAYKAGMLAHPCFDFCGEVLLLDIGIKDSCYASWTAVVTEESIKHYIPKRPKSANKGKFGKLLNISGSTYFSGASILSTRAALRTGVGLTILATPKTVAQTVVTAMPECTFLPLKQDDDGFISAECTDQLGPFLKAASAVSIGCGLGNREETHKVVEYVIKNCSCPIVLDADGINSVVGNINVLKDNKKIIITPHPAEFARLTKKSVSTIQKNRLTMAKDFAAEYGVTVVLKGVNTVIASPDGTLYVNNTGNVGLARGGSGDVLTGVIASLISQDVGIFEAAVLGVYLHGLAADELAKRCALAGILPSDIVETLPFVMSN